MAGFCFILLPQLREISSLYGVTVRPKGARSNRPAIAASCGDYNNHDDDALVSSFLMNKITYKSDIFIIISYQSISVLSVF